MSLPIEKDRVVSIHYTLTNNEGDVLDSSSGRDPLNYLHGAGNIISGLENALAGRQSGDALQVTIQPEDAYGLPNPDLVQTVPREAFSGVEQLEALLVQHVERGGAVVMTSHQSLRVTYEVRFLNLLEGLVL